MNLLVWWRQRTSEQAEAFEVEQKQRAEVRLRLAALRYQLRLVELKRGKR